MVVEGGLDVVVFFIRDPAQIVGHLEAARDCGSRTALSDADGLAEARAGGPEAGSRRASNEGENPG